MAGYTLNSFKTDEALKFCEDHGFRYLCVKNHHYAAVHGRAGAGEVELARPKER